MIDFCMKRMCGILLSRLQATARKVVKDPIKNVHARRMREDVLFYRDWLLPKFQLYCDTLGWVMPKVGAFEIEDDDLQAEGMGWIEDSIENANNNANNQPCQRDDDVGDTTSCLGSLSHVETSSLRSKSSKNSVLSPTSLLGKLHRRKESQEDKISAARLRAAKMIQPKPFTESKVHRLNELKAAKHRAEERVRARNLGSVDSLPSQGTLQTLQADEDIESEVTRQALVFLSSLPIHVVLSLLRNKVFEVAGIRAGEILNIMLVALQAISLRALLFSSILYAFEDLDYGQKKIVANMDYGKKLFIQKVKRISLVATVSIATTSCAFGFATEGIVRLCTLEDFGVMSTISQWWEQIPGISLEKLLTFLNISNDAMDTFKSFTHTIKIYVHQVGGFLNRIVSRLQFSNLRSLLEKDHVPTTFGDITSRISNLGGVCKSKAISSENWGARALRMSSFVTLRLGVFVLALMLMGYLLLPKPDKQSMRKKGQNQFGPRETQSNSEIDSVPSSLSFAGEEMEIIAEENE